MRALWKVLLTLALVVPMGAFVAGTLVASSAREPEPRETIVIDDTSGSSRSGPSDAQQGRERDKDDDAIDEVSPRPEDIGGSDDDAGGDSDDSDDDSEAGVGDDSGEGQDGSGSGQVGSTSGQGPNNGPGSGDGGGGGGGGGTGTTGTTTTPGPAAATTTTRVPATATTSMTTTAQAAAAAAAVGPGAAPETTTRATTRRTRTTTRATTTDLEPAVDGSTNARPDRPGVSVRTRITAAVALLVALALTGAGAIVYLIESQRIDQEAADRVDQEFAELARFQANERTGGRFTDVQGLLKAFLGSNLPDENETLVSWYDGGVQDISADPGIDASTAEFRAAADTIALGNGSTSIVQDGDTLLLDAQTVQIGADSGALIVVTYLTETRQGLIDTMQTYAIVALLSLILITGLAWAQSGRLLAPLRTLRETADEVSDSDLSRRLPVTGNDDITALTRTVNRMLDRLEAAFVGQRQFLDDAGHELKTPLTVLRGHLELLDVGSPVEVAETKALLLDELDRMSRLVGDLILLAKRDRPDFVTPTGVDLTALTVDVLAKARGLGDRLWVLDQTADVSVEVDEQRLTQALLQLCDNAVKHTQPGQVIALGSSYEPGDVRLWVRDTGPGVPPEHREQIFQRFGRAVVPEHDEGFGLGLSIVQAIAGAHGGSVHVEDGEPHGARFVITLPLTGSPSSPESARPGGDDVAGDEADRREELSLWQGS